MLVSDVGLAFGRTIPVMDGLQLLSAEEGAPGIGLVFVPLDIDLDSASVTLTWWPTGCNQASPGLPPDWNDTASGRELSGVGCGQTLNSFSLWVDSSLSYTWDASNSAVVHATGTYSIGFSPQETFETAHNFTWIAPMETLAFRRQHSFSAWYPFDEYHLSTTLEVFGGDVNATALPIYFVHQYGGLSGYDLTVTAIHPAWTPRSNRALYVMFSIRRCVGAKTFAVTLFLTNYLLAAAMVWVAICAHFGRRPLPESALFLPLTNILLLPQLRAAMPGVPDFGIFMDLFGYYVNIVAIVFSALFMFHKIMRNRLAMDRCQDIEGAACSSAELVPSPGHATVKEYGSSKAPLSWGEKYDTEHTEDIATKEQRSNRLETRH